MPRRGCGGPPVRDLARLDRRGYLRLVRHPDEPNGFVDLGRGRTNGLAQLPRILLNEAAADVAQRLRAAEGRFELQGDTPAEQGLEVGHDREIRSSKPVNALPVVADSEKVTTRAANERRDQACAGPANVLELVNHHKLVRTLPQTLLDAVGRHVEHVIEVDASLTAQAIFPA